jgi:hypothetical protein
VVLYPLNKQGLLMLSLCGVVRCYVMFIFVGKCS